jgi:predicted kinase
LAANTHSALVALRCEADPTVVAERLRARSGGAPASGSDADEAIAERMRAAAQPWPDAVVIPTDVATEQSIVDAVVAVRGVAG